MKMTRIGALAALALGLGACGGGDGSGDSPREAPAAPQAAPQAALPVSPYTDSIVSGETSPPIPSSTSARLIVDPLFDFDSGREVPVTIDFPEARGKTASLSLCLDWTLDEGAHSVDYGSCVLRTKLVDGYFRDELTFANQYGSVLAIVWFEDLDQAPVYREISLDA